MLIDADNWLNLCERLWAVADLLGGEDLIATIVLIISQPAMHAHHYEYDEYGVEYGDEYDGHGIEYVIEFYVAFRLKFSGLSIKYFIGK